MLKTFIQKSYNKGFFHLLSANALVQLVAFMSQLFVAGILIPEDIGRIKIIQTYLTIFVILGSLGFNSSTLKLCSEKRSVEEKESIFRSAFYLTLFATLTLYIILFICNSLNLFFTDKIIINIFPLGMIPVMTSSLFLVFTAYFQATSKIKQLSFHTTVNKLLSIIAIIILTYLAGINGYFYAYSISSFLIVIICIWEFRHILFKKINFNQIKSDFLIHWSYANKSMLSYIISESGAFIDIILIGYFILDLKEVGFYGFALTMTVIFRLIPSTVQQISIPYFSNIGNDKKAHKNIYNKFNKITILAIFGTLILAIIFVPIMTHYIFKSKYDDSMNYFPFLAIGWSFRVLSVFPNGAIFGIGKIKYNIYIGSISLILNIVLLSISLYFWGLKGAAITSIPNGIINFIITSYFYRKSFLDLKTP